MKVYRVKGKSRTKRYFRRGDAQRYVNHFTQNYSFYFEKSKLPSFSPRAFHFSSILMLFISSFFIMQFLSTVITTKNIFTVLQTVGHSAVTIEKNIPTITFPSFPTIEPIHLPSFHLPAIQLSPLPHIPVITFPHISFTPLLDSFSSFVTWLAKTLNPLPLLKTTVRFVPKAFSTALYGVKTATSFLNPFPFYMNLWNVSVMFYQQVFYLGGVLIQTSIVTTIRVIPLFNPTPLVLGSVHIVSITCQFIYHGGLSIIHGIGNGITHTLPLLNPMPLFQTIGHIGEIIENGIMQGILLLYHRISNLIVITVHTILTLLTTSIHTIRLLAQFTVRLTISFSVTIFQTVTRAIIWCGQLLIKSVVLGTQFFSQVAITTSQGIWDSIRVISSTLYQLGLFIMKSLVQGVIVATKFLWQSVVIIMRFTYEGTVIILHLLDPRPLFFRISSILLYRAHVTERFITRALTSIWNFITPPFVYVGHFLFWMVDKGINDLKGPSQQAVVIYPTPVVTQYNLSTNTK